MFGKTPGMIGAIGGTLLATFGAEEGNCDAAGSTKGVVVPVRDGKAAGAVTGA